MQIFSEKKNVCSCRITNGGLIIINARSSNCRSKFCLCGNYIQTCTVFHGLSVDNINKLVITNTITMVKTRKLWSKKGRTSDTFEFQMSRLKFENFKPFKVLKKWTIESVTLWHLQKNTGTNFDFRVGRRVRCVMFGSEINSNCSCASLVEHLSGVWQCQQLGI